MSKFITIFLLFTPLIANAGYAMNAGVSTGYIAAQQSCENQQMPNAMTDTPAQIIEVYGFTKNGCDKDLIAAKCEIGQTKKILWANDSCRSKVLCFDKSNSQ